MWSEQERRFRGGRPREPAINIWPAFGNVFEFDGSAVRAQEFTYKAANRFFASAFGRAGRVLARDTNQGTTQLGNGLDWGHMLRNQSTKRGIPSSIRVEGR